MHDPDVRRGAEPMATCSVKVSLLACKCQGQAFFSGSSVIHYPVYLHCMTRCRFMVVLLFVCLCLFARAHACACVYVRVCVCVCVSGFRHSGLEPGV